MMPRRIMMSAGAKSANSTATAPRSDALYIAASHRK
jgi:hypothetical protein